MHAWEEQYGWESAAPVGLPDAARGHDRGVVREMPYGDRLRGRGGKPESGVRFVRARRVLRLPHDHGLHGSAQAGSEPHEDRFEALTRVGVLVDSRSPGGQAEHVDAADLVQTRTPAVPRTRFATRSRSTPRSSTCSRTRRSRILRFCSRRAETPSADRSSSSRSAAWRATSPRTRTAWPPASDARSGQPLQNIGNKTSYEWLFDWVRDPQHFSSETYMPDLRLTNREAADIATYLTTAHRTGGAGRGSNLRRCRDHGGATRLR